MADEEGPEIVAPITCQEVAQWASVYLEDHGSDERKRQIVLHLAICAGCEAYVKQLVTVRDVVGLLPKVDEQPRDSQQLRQAFVGRTGRSSSN